MKPYVPDNVNGLTLMLLMGNCVNRKLYKKTEKHLKPWHKGTHLRVLSESYPMNTIAQVSNQTWHNKRQKST